MKQTLPLASFRKRQVLEALKLLRTRSWCAAPTMRYAAHSQTYKMVCDIYMTKCMLVEPHAFRIQMHASVDKLLDPVSHARCSTPRAIQVREMQHSDLVIRINALQVCVELLQSALTHMRCLAAGVCVPIVALLQVCSPGTDHVLTFTLLKPRLS
jgi:hypothetical protein